VTSMPLRETDGELRPPDDFSGASPTPY
jgi:hypothetical protein